MSRALSRRGLPQALKELVSPTQSSKQTQGPRTNPSSYFANDPTNYTKLTRDIVKDIEHALLPSQYVASIQAASPSEILQVFGHNDKTCTTAVAQFGAALEGYQGVVHGGCVGAILDELFAWTIVWTTGRVGFTANLSVNFRRALPINHEVLITTTLDSVDGRKVVMRARIEDGDGVTYTDATALFLVPPTVAKL
ncbi:Aste57867_4466 [Aphanomyces stellatus]|uniref:Acyl-coenzyme A thioesterase THEM4 n=1 Tax=Aphanomyces stellatus TaxID=120398 RepID=A0A485KFX9_9STRA|nr:hypothetical protein As57867_004454 [Aphanomyces stellatus]VFT81577.1 Aste57867_4466 [Aphanomyces stellatus]